MENALPPQCLVFDPEHESPNLSGCLTALGYRVTTASSAETALAAVTPTPYKVAFIAVRSREPSGIELVSSLTSLAAGLDVVAIVRPSDIDAALEAGRRGARSCIPCPVAFADVDAILDRLSREHATDAGVDAVTTSPGMLGALNAALKAAQADTPILLRGEPGSGEESLARLVHEHSPRHAKPFASVRCAGRVAEELAAELSGKARAADGGTLFLDEIGALPPDLQGAVARLVGAGDSGAGPVDVRVIASTSQALGDRLGQDLRLRLSVVTIDVPPLRQRPEDILALAQSALARLATRLGRASVPELGQTARTVLLGHTWPGNLPELESEIERALVMTTGAVIESSAFSESLRTTARAAPYVGGDFTIQEIERAHIERVLARSRTFDGAAQLLGIDDSTLWRKRKRYATGSSHGHGATRSNGNGNGVARSNGNGVARSNGTHHVS